jgi:hypothetical protein
MADNTALPTSDAGGDTIRTEDHSGAGIKTPVTLIDVGGTGGTEAILGDATVYLPVEGAAAHDAAAAGNPILCGAQFDDTTPDSVDEGDVGQLRMSANRNLYSTIRDAAGNERGLNVDASGEIGVTNSGTFATQATLQAGTAAIGKLVANSGVDIGDVDVLSVAGTVTVDGSGVTQPVSGTVTANLSATDNAVLDTINTAVELIDDAVYVDDADWTDSTSKHILVGGVYQSSPQTITDGDVGPLEVTANGYLIVSVNGTVTVDGSGVTQPVSGTVTANLSATDNAVLDTINTAVELIDDAVYVDDADWTDSTSKHVLVGGVYQSSPQTITDGDVGPLEVTANGYLIVSVNGTVTVDGSGVTQPVSGTVTANLSATDNAVLDNIQTAVELIDNAISGTEMQVDVVAALPAGTNAIGKLAANAGVDIGDVTPIPKTSGGVSFYKTIDLDESEEQVKATAGQVYGLFFTNSNAAVRYLKLYNATAASVTVGTTVPDLTLAIPPDNGGLFIKLEMGIAFSTAISIAATTGVADNDAGAPAANEIIGFVLYK